MATYANEQPAPPIMTYDQYVETLRSLVLNEDVRRVVAEASDEDKVALATSIIEEAIAYQDYEMARSVASDDETSQIDLLSRLFDQLDAPSTVPYRALGRGTRPSSSSRHRSQDRDPGQATDTSDRQTSDNCIRRDCTACQGRARTRWRYSTSRPHLVDITTAKIAFGISSQAQSAMTSFCPLAAAGKRFLSRRWVRSCLEMTSKLSWRV